MTETAPLFSSYIFTQNGHNFAANRHEPAAKNLSVLDFEKKPNTNGLLEPHAGDLVEANKCLCLQKLFL